MTPELATRVPAELAARYPPRRLLGEGGFGVVVAAEDTRRGDIVALKVFKGDDEEARERFLREARLAARISHPNVVSVRDAGELGGAAYMVSEIVAGGDLEGRLERAGAGGMGSVQARRLARDLLAGLEAIHDAGVLHRDLKPANVLLHEDGRAAITDFGMGRGGGEVTMTKTGQILGTPGYMAPEQFEGLEPTPPTDLYALGLILYEVACGERPHPLEGGLGAVMGARMAGTHPSLGTRGVTDPDLVALVDALLEPEVTRRPAGARGARLLLEGQVAGEASPLAEAVGGTGAHPPVIAEVAPAGGRRGPWVALGLAACLVLGFRLGSRGASPPEVKQAAPVTGGGEAAASVAAARERLAKLRLEVRGDDAIRDGTGLTAEMATEDAVGTWTRARDRFRRMAREARLPELVSELRGATYDPATHEAAVDLRRFEALLGPALVEGVDPLWPAGEEPGLADLVAETVRVEPVPGVGARSGDNEDPLARDLNAIGRSFGGAWVAVRTRQDLRVLPGEDGQPWYDSRVKFQNLDGVVFANPIASVRSELQLIVRKVEEVDRAEAPPEVRFHLRALAGEGLELVLMLRDCLRIQTVQVEIIGVDSRLAWVGVPPQTAGRRSDSTYRAPIRLRVAAARLPESVQEVRVTGLGIQAVRPPNDFFRVGNVYQRLSRPSP